MAALKTYLPTLAGHVGKSADRLIELQRAMVLAKILINRPGLGPGSGVELTGQSVATMLLALLSSEIRSDTVERVKSVASYRPVGKKGRCTVTGAINLRESLASSIENDCTRRSRRASLYKIGLTRSENSAHLVWRSGSRFVVQRFEGPELPHDPIHFETALSTPPLDSIIAETRGIIASAGQTDGAK